MGISINIRPFAADDAAQVRDLFIRVNRLLAPPDMKEAFEGYIASSLKEEIDRISDYYYRERGAGCRVGWRRGLPTARGCSALPA